MNQNSLKLILIEIICLIGMATVLEKGNFRHEEKISCQMGSSIVAIRSERYIIIGADSKIVTLSNNQYKDLSSENKIHLVGKSTYVACAGISSDEINNFEVKKLAQHAISNSSSLEEATDFLSKSVERSLIPVLNKIRSTNPIFFKTTILKNGAVDILVAGIEEGIPKLFSISIGVDCDKNDCIAISSKVKDHNAGNENMVFFGEHDKITSLLKQNPNLMRGRNGMTVVAEFIRDEIKAKPEHVGAPIVVVEITPVGIKQLVFPK